LTLVQHGDRLDTDRMRARCHRIPASFRFGVAASAIAAVVGLATRPAAQSGPADLVITNVRVVHGDGRVTDRADVSVRGGTIASVVTVADAGSRITEPARRTIDGRGLTLLPGLIDAHVTLESWMPAVFLKYGVTTVRDLHGTADEILSRAATDGAGEPRVIAAGGTLEAGADAPMSAVREAVRRRIERGARVLFAPAGTEPSLLATIVSAARARGVPVAAEAGTTRGAQAADLGAASLEGLDGVAEWNGTPPERLDLLARDLAARGVALVPMLARAGARSTRLSEAPKDPALIDVPSEVTARWMGDTGSDGPSSDTADGLRPAMARLQRFVRVFSTVNGRVVTGSGAGMRFIVPGASLHRELEQLVTCGLTPARALRAATTDAAALLGIGDRVGTIDADKAADLLLVEGDPLADIRHARRIVAVVRDGAVVAVRGRQN
jgi:imidazolonepropionase-like amidohydrolase